MVKEKGSDVTVFLVDDAIAWGQFGMANTAKTLTGEEMKPLIDYLLANKSDIIACKAWVDHRFLSPDEMLPGVRIEGAPYLLGLVNDSDKWSRRWK